MFTTRWKLMAGLLGISFCGLAAIANSSGQIGSPLSCSKVNTERLSISTPSTDVSNQNKTQPIAVHYNPPIEVPPPQAPNINIPAVAPPSVITPAIPVAEQQTPYIVALPQVNPAPVQGVSLPANPLPNVQPSLPGLPPVNIAPVASQTPPAVPVVSQSPPPIALPAIDTVPLAVPEIKIAPQTPTKPELTLPTKQIDLPLTPIPGTEAPSSTLIPSPVKPIPTTPTPSTNDGVKVIVRMTSGRPSLAILSDGAEMLTLTCEQLDLAARGPGDDSVSAIKASGKVTFTAPGCQGMCDELVLNPKSWDGTMLKNVRVKCSQGHGESELNAEKMTFKLRSPHDAVVPTVPASHSTPARKE